MVKTLFNMVMVKDELDMVLRAQIKSNEVNYQNEVEYVITNFEERHPDYITNIREFLLTKIVDEYINVIKARDLLFVGEADE